MPEQKPHYVRPFEEDEYADTDQLFVKGRKSNLWLDAWRDMRRRPMFYISVTIILVILAMALFPSWFTDVAPDACQLANSNGSPNPVIRWDTPARAATSTPGLSTGPPRRYQSVSWW